MTLSLAIVTHNRYQSLSNLLASIAKQSIKSEKIYLITNSDNEPDIQKIIFSFKASLNISNISTDCSGISPARQLALKYNTSDILYFVDDDCELPSKNHLEKLITLHQKHSQKQIIGGGYSQLKGSLPDKIYNTVVKLWILKNYPHSPMLPGGNISFKKSISPHIKYSEQFISSGEDTALNILLHQKGFQFYYDKNIDVFHFSNLKINALIKKLFMQGRTKFKIHSLQGSEIKKSKKKLSLNFLKEARICNLLVATFFIPFIFLGYISEFILTKTRSS